MRIYTKTGDDGTTGLLGGGRVSKHHARIAALGDLDELNAAIGLCMVGLSGELLNELTQIQNALFECGAEVAVGKDFAKAPASLSDEDVRALEKSMDKMTTVLPELTAFVLPGGSELAARLHMARAVCRRGERSLWALQASSGVRPIITTYLNRLSDWLFVVARWANHASGMADTTWIPRAR